MSSLTYLSRVTQRPSGLCRPRRIILFERLLEPSGRSLRPGSESELSNCTLLNIIPSVPYPYLRRRTKRHSADRSAGGGPANSYQCAFEPVKPAGHLVRFERRT